MRRAFTLIEVLCALALLGVVTIAAYAFLESVGRLGEETAARLAQERSVAVVLDLLRDDLLAALPLEGEDFRLDPADGSLSCQTLNQAGAETPGRQLVHWSFDPVRRRVLRQSRPAMEPRPEAPSPPRPVAGGFREFRFETNTETKELWLIVTAAAATSHPQRLRCWPLEAPPTTTKSP
jgi:prepilin-type N-terminal cleavage/methylation domain-containing protein